MTLFKVFVSLANFISKILCFQKIAQNCFFFKIGVFWLLFKIIQNHLRLVKTSAMGNFWRKIFFQQFLDSTILLDPRQVFWYKFFSSATNSFDSNFVQKWKMWKKIPKIVQKSKNFLNYISSRVMNDFLWVRDMFYLWWWSILFHSSYQLQTEISTWCCTLANSSQKQCF